jgi:integrase
MVRSVSFQKPLLNTNRSNHNSMNQRSLVLFHSAIKSEKTKTQYEYHLKKFKEYFIIKSFDDLVEFEDKKMQIMVEDYILHSKNEGKQFGTMNSALNALKLFFSMNDIIINWTKLKKMLPEKKKATGQVPYTTEQVQVLLKYAKNPKFRALIHFLSASGVRIGSFTEMKVKHVNQIPFASDGSKSILVYADTVHEYHTFIHQEAVEALDEYLDSRSRKGEIITPDSWVFPSYSHSTKPSSTESLTTTMARYVKNSLGREQAVNGRFEVMTCHGLRKRFGTICKNNNSVNISNAEKLMGHSVTVPLDNHYHKPLLETLFDEYQKHIPQLMIDDKYRLQKQLKEKDEKINELNQKDNEIDMLKQTILEIKNNMLELQNKIKS